MATWRIRRPPETGVEPVAAQQRILRSFDLFVLWSSLGVGLLVLAAGSLLPSVFGLRLPESIAVAILGSVIGSLMLVAAGHHGSRAGVPTMVSLRPVLGRRGSYFPTVLNVLQLLGWASFELLVMGYAAGILAGPVFGRYTPLFFVPLFGVVVLILALGGPLAVVRQWLEKFAIWIVYGSTLAIVVGLLITRPSAGPPDAGLAPGPPQYFLALDLVIVMPISWWPLVADYNRFARSPRDAAVGTFLGYTAANTAFYALGAALFLFASQWLALVAFNPAPGFEFLIGIGLLGFGALPLLFILVDETDNAFANVYSTAVSVQNLAPRRRQFWIIIAATAIATTTASYLGARGEGLGGPYANFLFLIGGVFVPLLGVVVVDSFLLRRGSYRPAEFFEEAPHFRWVAFASWAPGMLLYFAIVFEWISDFPPIGATIPSFALAAGLHATLALLERSTARKRGGAVSKNSP